MSPNKYKNSDRIMNVNEPKTQFWGVCCEGGKIYSQVVKQRFYITQAVLEPDTELRKSNDEFVKVEMQRDGFSYLLCVLQHDAVYQVSLNYIFDKGEKVAFRVDGKGKVFLSGYQVADLKVATNVSSPSEGVQSSPSKAGKKPEGVFEVSSISPEKGETVQENEVAEVPKATAETSKSKKPVSNKASSKAFWNSLLNGTMGEDEDDEDEDYVAGEEEESESDDAEYDDDEDDKDVYEETVEASDDDDDEEEEEEDDDEEDDDDDEEEEMEVLEANTSGKRKQFQKNETSMKRQKGLQSSNKPSSSDSDSTDSSSETEPVPKKSQVGTKSAEKKKRKKKKLLDISQKSQPHTPQTMSQTPENKSSAKKLQGGVEIQDVRIGSGPIARPGKMLHVYYVGKLADSSVFDSRTRGKKPFSFKLGGQQVIKGWEIALEGMRVGGRRKVVIPPRLGYGNNRIEGIPPNSTLYFTVELEAVN